MTGSAANPIGQFGWLVTDFTQRVPGVARAVVVSTDGLLLTSSSPAGDDRAGQLAAVAAALVGLTVGAARCLDGQGVVRTMVQMQRGVLLLMTVRDGSCLAVLASADCAVGQVAYEMSVLVDRVGRLLTPELRAQLQALHRASVGQPA